MDKHLFRKFPATEFSIKNKKIYANEKDVVKQSMLQPVSF